MRNHKTVVLQQPVGDHAFERLCSIVFLAPVWESTLFLLEPKSIEHFIFIGHFAHIFESFVCNHNNNLHIISESLNEITFCEDELDTVAHWTKLPESVKHINLVNCTFSLGRLRFQLSPQDEFLAAAIATMGKDYRYQSRPSGIEWHVRVFVPHLEFTSFVEDGDEDDCYQLVLK